MPYSCLFILTFTLNQIFCSESRSEAQVKSQKINPGALLNFQDVPLFYNQNPLEKLNAFAVSLWVNNPEGQRKLSKILENELKSIGEVIHLSVMDMRGFGTGTVLMILIKRVSDWQGNEMPISRVSLQVQTTISVNKTNLTTFPVVWGINSFFQGNSDQKPDDQMVKATQSVIKEFVQNYKYSNQAQEQKPIFYMYD